MTQEGGLSNEAEHGAGTLRHVLDRTARLGFEQHAETLRAVAPELSVALSSSAVAAAIEQFREDDAQAQRAQGRFGRWTEWSNRCIALASVASGAVMFLAILAQAMPEAATWIPIAGVLGFVGGAAATVALGVVRQEGLLDRWLRLRASAEAQRRQIFEATFDAMRGGSLDHFLAYFAAAQLDGQTAYHRKRAGEHGSSGSRWIIAGSLGLFLAAVASGLAGVLASGTTMAAGWAVLGSIGSALGAYSVARSALGQYRTKQELHEAGWRALLTLRAQLDEVTTAAARREAEVVQAFVSAVHEAMKGENDRWLEASTRIADEMQKLQEALRKQEEARPRAPGGAGH